MTNNTEALRKEFEADKISTTAVRWNGKRYIPTDQSSYAEGVAHSYNLGFAEFGSGYQAAHASQQKVIDSLRAENERLIESLSRIRFHAARSSIELLYDIREWESTPIEDDD